MSQRLSDLLLQDNVVTAAQLAQAMVVQKQNNCRLGAALLRMRALNDEELSNYLSQKYGIPAINLAQVECDAALTKLVPQATAQRYQVLPLNRSGNSLTVAMSDPTDVFAVDDLKFMTGCNVEPVVAPEGKLLRAIEQAYRAESGETAAGSRNSAPEAADVDIEVEADDQPAAPDMQKAAAEAPIVKLVNAILGDAVRRGASDIHLEPYENEFRVRFRIDGVLQEQSSPPFKMKDAIASRLKIMAKLDISERRLPQDGRMMLSLRLAGRRKQLDFRVSTLPTLWGEKIVLRLLDKENLQLDMTRLGFEPESLAKFEAGILKPYGMVLVTGPTGSGKTNTLYSAISRLNQPGVNIMTAEDPVEFQLAGINQVQTKEAIGLTFAAALRSFLRQDPNIILVGEIRDLETAEIGIRAALTGHLVLSTLHTNGAPETITRLTNMGVEAFLVATSVHLICAQRLVRRICRECAEAVQVPVAALIGEGYPPEEAATIQIQRGRGCAACHRTGYKGRTGLYEVMVMDEVVRDLVLRGASAVELKQAAVAQGMITLRRSGLIKVAAGVTTLAEVARETIC
jgi:type IV pilus assembly protein PilB